MATNVTNPSGANPSGASPAASPSSGTLSAGATVAAGTAAAAPPTQGTQATTTTTVPRWQWAINLLLLFLVLGGAGWWGVRHFHGWQQAVGLGTLAFVQVVLWLIAKLIDNNLPKHIWNLVGHQRGIYVLLIAAGIVAVASLVTSSIHVEYRGSGDSVDEFHLETSPTVLERPLVVSARKPVDSARRFFRFRANDVQLVVRSPIGYQPTTARRFGIGSSLLEPVPTAKKNYSVLRIVPGCGLDAPDLDDRVAEPLWLRIVTAQGTYPVSNLRQQAIYAGASKEALALLEQADDSRRNEEYEQYLLARQVASDDQKPYLRGWNGPPLLLDTHDFTTGESITLEYGHGGTVVWSRKFVVRSNGIETLFVEESDDGAVSLVTSAGVDRH